MTATSEQGTGTVWSDKYRLLLAETARLYEKHVVGHRKPFNAFAILRSESDEVNLHSRFLVTVLAKDH